MTGPVGPTAALLKAARRWLGRLRPRPRAAAEPDGQTQLPAEVSLRRRALGGDCPHAGLWPAVPGPAGGRTDWRDAWRAMLAELRSRLPEPRCPVLVIGHDPVAAAEQLAWEGHPVTAAFLHPAVAAEARRRPAVPGLRLAGLLDPVLREAGAASWAAVLVLECGAELAPRARLEALHSSLRQDGELLLIDLVADTGEQAAVAGVPLVRQLAVDLAETGFATLESRSLGERVRPTFDRLAASIRAASEATPEEDPDSQTSRRLLRLAPALETGAIDYRLFVARRQAHLIRSYREGDEEPILELFARCFHRRRSLDHWRWKYCDNPSGDLKISVAEAPDGGLVAHYAAYPCRLLDLTGEAPRSILAHQIGDTMTAPEARRIGRGASSLLRRLTAHHFALYCEEQVGFNYGFNTGKIQRYYTRLVPGSRFLEAAPFRVLERSSEGFPALRGAAPEGLRVRRVEELDDRWDALLERVAPDYRLLVARDSRYLRWRYLGRPDVDYLIYAAFLGADLVGWAVFRQRHERLEWGDALFDRRLPRAAAHLLEEVLASPELRDVRRVEAWFPSRPVWWDQIVTEIGFTHRPEPEDLGMIYKPFLERDLHRLLSEHLYFTKSDGDLF
jgi:hypothetical protein